MPAETLFVRIPEAAESLGLGRSKFYELLQAHELKTVRIGRRVLVPVAELRRYAQRVEDEAEFSR